MASTSPICSTGTEVPSKVDFTFVVSPHTHFYRPITIPTIEERIALPLPAARTGSSIVCADKQFVILRNLTGNLENCDPRDSIIGTLTHADCVQYSEPDESDISDEGSWIYKYYFTTSTGDSITLDLTHGYRDCGGSVRYHGLFVVSGEDLAPTEILTSFVEQYATLVEAINAATSYDWPIEWDDDAEPTVAPYDPPIEWNTGDESWF